MEPILAILSGLFFAASIYLMLSHKLVRVVLGVAVLGNAANLVIFTAGRLVREVPPIVALGQSLPPPLTANPLPQALILTAIVISFALFAFLIVLAYRAFGSLGSDDSDAMRLAEPVAERPPPAGY